MKAAKNRRVQAIFAANRVIPGIEGDFVVMALCSSDYGAADDHITALAEQGDIAVTRDVPLAGRLICKGVSVIDDRGRAFTRENIRTLLSVRDFNIGLALGGVEIVRAASYGKKELKLFADSFDRLLTAALHALRPGVPQADQGA
ncbi:MAG: DUF188 domain-containing protein [Spirochaetaceae bacterium]|jgi:uncharacterized protein YaiI (UPF0178 family)|nr:DUF188 domain-containing protein [Spirochaetaceae bacterium]